MGDPPGRDFNEDNMLNGLFKGYLLLRVHYRQIVHFDPPLIVITTKFLGRETHIQRAIYGAWQEAMRTSSMQCSFIWYGNGRA